MVPDFLRIAVRNSVLNVVVLLLREISGVETREKEKGKGETNVRSVRRGFVAGMSIIQTRSRVCKKNVREWVYDRCESECVLDKRKEEGRGEE